MSQILKRSYKHFLKVCYNYNIENSLRLSFSSKSSDTENNNNNNNENKTNDSKSDEKSLSKEPVKEVIDESKLGPDDEIYDPSKDPLFNAKVIGYKYPQYFTRRYRELGFGRAYRIFKDDLSLLKEGRIHKRPDEMGAPYHADIVIFGGGIMGSSIAYWLKQRAPNSFSCAVIERDPTYTRASTTLSVGGIRQQFSLKENILMSMFSIDFLRNVKKHLSVLDMEPPDISFHPHGYLVLASESGAQQLVENHSLQIELGAFVELYTPDKLKSKFPWINTEGVALGSYGVQNEGWFDPWALLVAFKTKAETLGVEYVQADILDFNLNTKVNTGEVDESGYEPQTCNHVIVREPDGTVKQIEFAVGIVCCGANSGFIAKKLEYGEKQRGVRSFALPVEPRKRYVYVFNCPDGPGIDFPLLVDNSSVYCRREGLGGNFICGRSPSESEEPDTSNLDVDYSYFDRAIWPQLAHRVKAFESIKLKSAWAGFYEYNTLDQNPIIGRDPYYNNILWATGFSGHGIQMAPAVGRAIMELLYENNYQTIDLRRFGWQRVLRDQPLRELNIF